MMPRTFTQRGMPGAAAPVPAARSDPGDRSVMVVSCRVGPERQIAAHLEHLAEVHERTPEPGRFEAVLTTYAQIQRERARHSHSQPHFSELAALVHDDDQVTDARRQLHRMIRDLFCEAATAGRVRDDIGAGELAGYCMHAFEAAGHAPSDAAVRRLVAVTMDGMRSQVDH